MHSEKIPAFSACLPLIRTQWIKLLADESPLSPLGRTETVGYLMDVTLIQLVIGLRALPKPISSRTRLMPAVSQVLLHLACGIAPLKKYFSTGEQAIRACADSTPDANVEQVIAVFREIAALEIGSLCAACSRHDTACCEKSRNGPG